ARVPRSPSLFPGGGPGLICGCPCGAEYKQKRDTKGGAWRLRQLSRNSCGSTSMSDERTPDRTQLPLDALDGISDRDVDKSTAAPPEGKSTRVQLAARDDAEIETTIAQTRTAAGSTEAALDALEQSSTFTVGFASTRGQRYRALRPHAQGGLGAVFVALDQELHREVALKQILDHHADDPISRARFLREAEVTGGLEHPGIVPVYGLGAHGDGRPY